MIGRELIRNHEEPGDVKVMKKTMISAAFVLLALMPGVSTSAAEYDLVINDGRVMDSETKLDAVLNVGIKDGIIQSQQGDYLEEAT
jgi:N-acyl-D-amino-acid deacylase